MLPLGGDTPARVIAFAFSFAKYPRTNAFCLPVRLPFMIFVHTFATG